MPFSSLHRRVILGAVVVAAVPAAIVSTALGASSHASTVTLTEFKVAPAPKSVSAGKITFTVKNKGDMEHEMVVVKTTTAASKLKVSSGEASEKGSVGEVADIAGGKTKKLTLNLKKGHYVLLCNVKGHYQAGMHADFTVK
jgi:uncharacterized cupredoxin-like copper-binding protein